jgi:hypothetical protein
MDEQASRTVVFVPPSKADVEAAIKRMQADIDRELSRLRRQRIPRHCSTCRCWEGLP